MPERLDYVRATTSSGVVELPRTSREKLLGEIRHLDSVAGIVKAFTDVGATRPVTVSDEDRGLLLDLLEAWWQRVETDGLPPGIWDLRCAIADDLHDGPARARQTLTPDGKDLQ